MPSAGGLELAGRGLPTRKKTGLFRGHDPTCGSGQGVSKSRGSGRVGSRDFKNGHLRCKSSRIGSGRVNRLQNLAGRVGSGRVGSGRVKRFRNLAGRVGLGHDPRDTGHSGQAIMTRELCSADPRVKPVDLARGSALFKLTAEGHCRVGAPRV